MSGGIKSLSTDNWLEVDPASKLFVKISHHDESVSPMTGQYWISSFLSPAVVDEVPEDVRILFEAARGALAYGYFFYPLYSLASDQLFRVGEAAISAKCRSVGEVSSGSSFNDKINFLAKTNMITAAERSDWHVIRHLRNIGSHPECQHILPPGTVAGMLGVVADRINNLFKSC